VNLNLLKNKVEAILYGIGGKISLEDISKLCRTSESEVIKTLKELQQEYADRSEEHTSELQSLV